MKKFLALILASLMVSATLLSGCEAAKEEKKNNTTTQNNNGQSNTDIVGSDEDLTKVLSFSDLEKRCEALAEMTDTDKNILINVEGVEMSEAALRFAVISAYSAFETQEEIDKELKEFFLLNAAIVKDAEALGTNMTVGEFQENVEAYKTYYQTYYGDSYATLFDDTVYSPYFFYLNQCYNVLFSNLFSEYAKEDDSEFSVTLKNKSFEDMTAALEEGDYVRAKHILVVFPTDDDGNTTDAQKAETLAKAQLILEEVKAMKDPAEFDALIEKYGEDPGMESYPAGYYFTKGEMVEAFETASYALEEYGISDPVETPYGYHIIQRLPYDVETCMESSLIGNESFVDIYNNNAVNMLRDILLEKAKDYKMEYAEGYEAALEKYVAEYEAEWKEDEAE